MNYFIIGYQNWLDLMEVKKEPYGKTSTTKKTSSEDSEKLSVSATQHVQKMLKDIPKDLRDLFTPTTEDELLQLELHLAGFSKVQEERERVRHLQNQFGLTFRPNISLNAAIVRVKIAILKQSRPSKYPDVPYTDFDPEDMQGF